MEIKQEYIENAIALEELEAENNVNAEVEVPTEAQEKMNAFLDEYVKALHHAANVVYYLNMVTSGKIKTSCGVFAKDLYKYIQDRREGFKEHYDRVYSEKSQQPEDVHTTIS